MGANNCCCSRIQLTENNAENLIRESIHLLRIRRFYFQEFDEDVLDILSVSLLDISPKDILKWISKENYQKIIDNLVINSSNSEEFDFLKFQKHTCLPYDELFSEDNKIKINNLLLWAIPMTKPSDSQQGRMEKVRLIEKVIINTEKMITLNTFKRFLSHYIHINLLKITQNFSFSEELKDDKDLKNEFYFVSNFIFNAENIRNYVKKLTEKMSERILRKSVGDNANRDLSNEFLKSSHLIKFFTENSFLLDIIELRENFFSIYNENTPNFVSTEN